MSEEQETQSPLQIRVSTAEAFSALKLPPTDRLLRIMNGVFDESDPNPKSLRLSMVTQLQRERSEGFLVNRGPNQNAPTCSCSKGFWCSSWDRWRLLRQWMSDNPGLPDFVVFDGIQEQHPNSCLANQECFEICFMKAICSGRLVEIGPQTYRPETEMEVLAKAEMMSKLSLPQRKKIFPADLGELDYI